MKNLVIAILMVLLYSSVIHTNTVAKERNTQIIKTAEALNYADQWRGLALKYECDNNDLNAELDRIDSDKFTDTLLGHR